MPRADRIVEPVPAAMARTPGLPADAAVRVAVVLLSGGLDSATAAAWAIGRG